MSLSLSKCDFCKHLRLEDERNFPVCDAFLDGIPIEKEAAPEDEECADGIKYEEDGG